jgi:hypothetical protein
LAQQQPQGAVVEFVTDTHSSQQPASADASQHVAYESGAILEGSAD